ncbi:MAG: phosphatidate cytidylyltransferase [Clostridia bacterium]|nr:phosphatidate cytidylyltransferase [Clostridia bacterium]
MKIRLLSGSVYIALLAAFYLMKIFVPTYGAFCFDVLVYAFSLLGTHEMLRAMGDRTTKAGRGLVRAFSVVCIPAVAVFEYFYGAGITAGAVCLFVLSLALLSLFVCKHEETTPENIGVALLSAVYPTTLLCLLTLTNHAQVTSGSALAKVAFNSDLLILFVFVISPVADSLAYVFGRFLRKYFPKQMAPNISPNKTVIGGIGGLFGGMLGALILYFAYNAVAGSFANTGLWLPVYLAIGLLSAAATAFGDLVESCIKRKVGLKDMGKIMPGHGGVLDRIDGTLFACIVVYGAFIFLRAVL